MYFFMRWMIGFKDDVYDDDDVRYNSVKEKLNIEKQINQLLKVKMTKQC